MARRIKQPNVPEKASLTYKDMRHGIKKLERRITELKDFNLDTLDPDDPELSKIEDSVQMTITDIFGHSTIEYRQYYVHSLTSLSAISLSVGLYDDENTRRTRSVRAKCKGIQEAITKLEAARNYLKECIEDTDETPDRLVAQTIETLDLHPSIARTCSQKFRDGYYADAIETACKALNNLVKVASSVDDLDGDKLMRKVFSPNKPVLAFNDLSTETAKSEQRGMMDLYAGAISAFRNPRAHDLIDDDPDFALKAIGFISFLAELLEKTDLIE